MQGRREWPAGQLDVTGKIETRSSGSIPWLHERFLIHNRFQKLMRADLLTIPYQTIS